MPNTSMKEQQLYRHRRILQIECELLRRKSVEKIFYTTKMSALSLEISPRLFPYAVLAPQLCDARPVRKDESDNTKHYHPHLIGLFLHKCKGHLPILFSDLSRERSHSWCYSLSAHL